MMPEINPQISVVVPIYNMEKYLNCCIDSLLAQEFVDFEILLVDDGSSDQSGEICDKYALKDRRIRVLHKKNGGVSSARNFGIANAMGEYVCFVDADDYVDKEYLQSLYNDICTNNVELVVHGFMKLTPKRKQVGCEFYSDAVYDLKYDLYKMLLEQNFYYRGSPYAKLYKRYILVTFGIIFDTEIAFGEDLCFLLDYMFVVQRIYYSSNISYNYIQYRSSSVHKRFSFRQEYAGCLHLKHSFCKLIAKYHVDKNSCLPYIEWIAFFLYRSIIVIDNKDDYDSIDRSDWYFCTKHLQVLTLKGRIEKFIIFSICNSYYLLIAYLKLRRFF